MQCRTRKIKCQSVPPHDCDNCRRQRIQCVWPERDNRRCRAGRVTVSTTPATPLNLEAFSDADTNLGSLSQGNDLLASIMAPSIDESELQALFDTFLGDSSQMSEGVDNLDIVTFSTQQRIQGHVKWLRPHGRTAFVPGERCSRGFCIEMTLLKVCSLSSSTSHTLAVIHPNPSRLLLLPRLLLFAKMSSLSP